jgi:predicted phage baseplate assembly protein
MIEPCDCCTTTGSKVPLSTVNRPGLTALSYRIGTYASFFDALKSALSRFDLSGLKTRDLNDPAIAFLDAWAMVADVLTFYQERIANEGFLRTSTERQSVLELASLVGVALRPGVSASTSIAYTLDPSSTATIPAGSRVQSLPGQNQLPQSFEVSDDLPVQGAWNNLTPRLTRPQSLSTDMSTVYAAGLTTNLKPNDPLLVIASPPALRFVATVDAEVPQSRTKLGLLAYAPTSSAAAAAPSDVTAASAEATPASTATAAPASWTTNYVELLRPLAKPPANPPASSLELSRSVLAAFAPGSSAVPATVRLLKPAARTQFFTALANATVAPPPSGEIHAFRVKAAPFGHNAPLKPIKDDKGVVVGTEEWPLVDDVSFSIVLSPRVLSPRLEQSPLFEMMALFDEGQPLGFIQIALGAEKASQSLTFGDAATIQVGRWQVTTSFSDRTFKVTFVDFNWSCAIEFPSRASTLSITINGGQPLLMPIGQIAENAADGERLRISTLRGIAIDREAPVAPTSLYQIDLDSTFDQIVPNSWVTIEFPDPARRVITQVFSVQKVSVAQYGITGRVTRLVLNEPWLRATDLLLSAVRPVNVWAQSDQLDLAQEPIDDPVHGDTVELSGFYGDLPAGRWLIVAGERADIPNTTGVTGAELVMVGSVAVLPPDGDVAAQPGEPVHSQLKLAGSLSYSYKRDTVAIYGNVAGVTHGETKREVLGSGDGSQANQQFTLKQGPLTHVAAKTSSGTKSTLEVRVNDIPWSEVSSLTDAGPFDRCYITQTDGYDKTTIIFGDGVNGMRLPTGRENVTATYRVGVGSGGNVDASAINQLATRPFGVKAVAGPLAATGGVDRDGVDQGKANASRAAAALDRLVSVEDYADSARVFGGVGKAAAIMVPGGRVPFVYLSVAAATEHNGTTSYENLEQALLQAGDPNMSIAVDGCELMFLIVAASVTVTSDAVWQDVEPEVRSRLLDTFGYQQRDLGQSIALSEVIAAIQAVAGVAAVEVTTFDEISASDTDLDSRLKARLAEIGSGAVPASTIEVLSARIDPATMKPLPAQLAFLSADLPDALMLMETAS